MHFPGPELTQGESVLFACRLMFAVLVGKTDKDLSNALCALSLHTDSVEGTVFNIPRWLFLHKLLSPAAKLNRLSVFYVVQHLGIRCPELAPAGPFMVSGEALSV